MLAVELGAELGFALEQALRSARSGLATAQLFLQHAVHLVAPLLAGAQLPPRDDERMPTGRGHRRHMDLPQVHSCDGSSGQRRWQRFPRVQRQAEFVVIRPPGQLGPAQVGGLILLRQRQQERGPLPSRGQAQ